MYPGNRIGRADLEELIHKNSRNSDRRKAAKDGENALLLPQGIMDMDMADAKDSFEKHFLEFQLSKNNGIIQKTADAIGVNPGILYARIRKYGLRHNSKEAK